jgi:hypothetical protein
MPKDVMEGALQALALSPSRATNMFVGGASARVVAPTCRWPVPCDDLPEPADESAVHESSAKMRRNSRGHAIGLDEENNPSPTRLQRRSPVATPEQEVARLVSHAPLCDPRIAALRATAENVAPVEAAVPTEQTYWVRPVTPANLRKHAEAHASMLGGRATTKATSPLAVGPPSATASSGSSSGGSPSHSPSHSPSRSPSHHMDQSWP